jgi:hypothetical protein
VISRAPSGGSPTIPIALAALFAVLLGGSAAYAGSITIAWDRSPDPSVIGYRVYVGTTSGYYTQTFDVGNVTSFSYDPPQQRAYFFAVASYSVGPVIGALSREVATADSPTPGAWNYWSSLWSFQPKATRLARPSVCWMPAAQECPTVRTVATANGPVSSLAVSNDGRLFFVEGGRRIRVLTPTGLSSEPVLLAKDTSTILNQVVLDQTFTDTGFMWVSETESLADGRREFRIARYRLVQNQAGERAVMVAPIHLPESGNALFALDDVGRIYVSAPGFANGVSDPYGGKLLRFDADGTVPADNPTSSPVLAAGHHAPTGIALNVTSGLLWLSGFEGDHSSVRSVTTRSTPPAIVEVGNGKQVSVHAADVTGLLSTTPEGFVMRSTLGSANMMAAETLPLASQRATAVTHGPAGTIFVAIQTAGSATPTFTILQLSRVS